MHILIVDDIEETAHLFAWAFGVEGHTTECAEAGAEAVTLMETGHYDAIVMDVKMPGMDGIEAVRQIRQLPHGQQVPILVLTADRDDQSRRAALEAGANTVIFKPILPQVVLKRIEDYRP